MQITLQVEVEQLRIQCADYIEQHQKDLLPFLIDPETGETFSDGNCHSCLISYLMKFTDKLAKYLCDLKHTAMWGGQLEVSHAP